MDQEFAGVLRRRAAELRQARTAAAERGDEWKLAVHTVDLEELQYLALRDGIDISPATSPLALAPS
ncbi:hypothetical protein [Kitasatospora azatica]|uniref:hypothetical protein n=1 Tax=Kitasatospora azatica TaxID=58347 RepID=UPI00056BBD69|nr:hypothetical protein [Kitasatospora azatica]